MSKIGCEILQISPDKIKFALNNCDVSLANSLRRVLLSQVPTLAPHLISVVENTSVLHDQFLAQRIGLIPFYSQRVQDYKYTWDCDCSDETVNECQVCKNYFTLKVENLSQQTREVTSLDIQPIYPIDMQIGTKKPVIPVEFISGLDKSKKVGIPIVKLDKNQKVNLRFDVQKGFGKMHSKWSPVSLATFQPDPQIKIDEKVDIKVEQKKLIADSCPKRVFQMNQNNIQVAHQQRCIYCGQCTRKAESLDMTKFKNYLRIGKKKDRYIFTVESVGSMPASMIVKIAIKTLQQKLNQLQQKIN